MTINPAELAAAVLHLWNQQSVTRYSEDRSRWRTIGAERGVDGKNHGGQPVKLRPDGTIEAGLGGKFNGQKIGQAFDNTLSHPQGSSSADAHKPLQSKTHLTEPRDVTRDRQFEADLLKWRNMVASVGRKRGFNATDLDDFISETMLTAWKHRDHYDSIKGQFSTWLNRVAVSVANNMYRRNMTKKRGAGKGIQSLSNGFDNKPIDVMAREEPENLSEQMAILRPMIGHLPEAQRRVIRGLMNGETVASMSEYMRLSKQAVSQSLNRGIEALKKMTAGDDRFAVACQVERYANEAILEVPGLEDFHWRSVGRP